MNFAIYWQKENTEHEVRIVLPELYFEKKIAVTIPAVVIETPVRLFLKLNRGLLVN